MRRIVLLGPQRLKPTLVEAVDALGVKGAVAAVTAGWQEREDEIDELSAHLRRPTVNLRLHHRGEDVFQRDPELFLAYGDLLDRTRKLQELYRMRLGFEKDAVRALMAVVTDADLLDPEIGSAVDSLRELDRHHRERLARLREAFEAEWRPRERPVVQQHQEQIAAALAGCEALALAGGHVSVLLDRLRLFDVVSLSGQMPVFAWSAGAMVAGEQVVLFHDSPPQGAGNAEILDEGLGLCRGVLAFPHARRRLRTEDPARVALLARRFAPLRCLAMDDFARVDFDGRGRVTVRRAREMRPDGTVAEVLAS